MTQYKKKTLESHKCTHCQSSKVYKQKNIKERRTEYLCSQCGQIDVIHPTNKYGAETVLFEGKVFASKWEHHVYMTLRDYFSSDEIQLHPVIVLAEKHPLLGKWEWKCDFRITSLDIYIEAKGIHTRDWIEKMRALAILKPQTFDNLYVVGDYQPEPILGKWKTHKLSSLLTLLANKKNERITKYRQT
jgi:hypothetical protein